MSASFTLDNLKTAIKERVEDTGSQFAGSLNVIIQMGESRIVRELPLSIWQLRASVQIDAGDQTAPKPTDAIAIHNLRYTAGNGTIIQLKPRTVSYCEDYAPNTTQGTPRFFAQEYSETEIFIAPSPNVTVTGTALYTKRPTSIITLTAGTFISLKLGDLLLVACMSAAEEFDISPDLVAMWEQRYANLYISAVRDMAHLLPRNYTGLAAIPTATGKLER